MTDPRKFDVEAARLIATPQTLPERLAIYAKLFTLGLVAVVGAGSIVGVVLSRSIGVSIGYTAIFVGVILALTGGATGGGFANLGIGEGIDRMVSHSSPGFLLDEPTVEPSATRASKKYGVTMEPSDRQDLIGRLRRGLRPEKNPTALWTVIAGVLYFAIGAVLVLA